MSRVYAFTGTKQGMTQDQKHRVADILNVLQPELVHNGCCTGADRDMHAMCSVRAIVSEYHPSNEEQLAWAKSHRRATEVIRMIRDPLARNAVMVRLGGRGLIATPAQLNEVLRSGTWATIRSARKLKRPIWIITPQGAVRAE